LRLGSPERGAVLGDRGLSALSSARSFSATEIESYLACPYRWFYERVVRPEEIDEALDARGLGTYAHALLAQFYRRLPEELGCDRVTATRLEDALELFGQVAADERPVGAPHGLSEEMQLANAVAWARSVVGQDAVLLPDFAPDVVEFAFGDAEPFLFAGDLFRGRIDRIDASPTSVFVMDYKSSRDVTHLRDFEAGGKVQAVIYACAATRALGKPVSGSVYRSMRSGRLGGFWRSDLLDTMPAGMCEDEALDAPGVAELVARTEERVAGAIAGMRGGRVPRTPAIKGACTFCSLSTTCEGARP
jgi:ATP-dependent helicase/DNAse subunit B